MPSEEESENISEDDEADSELDDYYRELGITADDLKHSKKEDSLYKTTKKSMKNEKA